MPSPKELTRADVIRAAQTFRWTRKMTRWTVVVAGMQAISGIGSVVESLTEIAKGIPEHEWERVPRDLSKNLDHYLYGSRKIEK